MVSPESDICQTQAESDKGESKPFGGGLEDCRGQGPLEGMKCEAIRVGLVSVTLKLPGVSLCS